MTFVPFVVVYFYLAQAIKIFGFILKIYSLSLWLSNRDSLVLFSEH